MSLATPPLGLGEERIPPGEAALIASTVAINLSLLDSTKKPVQRGEHAKQHGLVVAEFVVEPNLADDLRVGLFREPKTYPALLRFSNGQATDDNKGDIHGLGVKLVGVPGVKVLDDQRDAQTHDFIFADHPVFFITNVAEYVRFAESVQSAKNSLWGKLVLIFKLILFPFAPWSLVRASIKKKPASPLGIEYWSQTPYSWGNRGVRYQVKPWLDSSTPPVPSSSPNKLREAMVAELKSGESGFDFLVQLQTDAVAMPIEDPTIAWDEEMSPPRKVATLRIPAQTFDTPLRNAFCETLSFTPWHCLPEHRPLGGINRARKVIYEAMSQKRHELNGDRRTEPTVEDIKNL